MTQKCDFGGCTHGICLNEGVHYRDWTITGIGDFRWFCDFHVATADAAHNLDVRFRKVKYQESVVRMMIFNLEREQTKLDNLRENPE